MHLGQLLFQTEGELTQRDWWFAQIFIWGLSAVTLCIYMKFGFHDALLTSVSVACLFLVENECEH